LLIFKKFFIEQKINETGIKYEKNNFFQLYLYIFCLSASNFDNDSIENIQDIYYWGHDEIRKEFSSMINEYKGIPGLNKAYFIQTIDKMFKTYTSSLIYKIAKEEYPTILKLLYKHKENFEYLPFSFKDEFKKYQKIENCQVCRKTGHTHPKRK